MSKETLRKFREKFILMKMYINRTSSYITLINSGMILFLLLSRLKEHGYIEVDITDYFLWLFFVGILGLLFIGWVEVRFLKGMSTELQKVWEFNPEFRKLKAQVNDIHQRLK